MFSKINSFGVHGVEGFPVTVEADVSDGLPGFIMVGFLSEAVREAQGDGKSVARGYKEGRDGL